MRFISIALTVLSFTAYGECLYARAWGWAAFLCLSGALANAWQLNLHRRMS